MSRTLLVRSSLLFAVLSCNCSDWLCCWFELAQPPASILNSTVNGTGIWNLEHLWSISVVSVCFLLFVLVVPLPVASCRSSFWRLSCMVFRMDFRPLGCHFLHGFSVRCLFLLVCRVFGLCVLRVSRWDSFYVCPGSCESVYMKCHLHVTCLFFVHPLFPGCCSWHPLGYTLRVSSRVYAAGLLVVVYGPGIL